jgi:hypothetical protein
MNQLKQRTFSDIECINSLSEWQNVTSTCAEGSSSTFTSKRCVPHIEWLGYMMIATVLYPNNASCQNDSNWIEASVTGPHCEPNGQQSYSFGCSATHEIFYGCTDSQCSDCQGSATRTSLVSSLSRFPLCGPRLTLSDLYSSPVLSSK